MIQNVFDDLLDEIYRYKEFFSFYAFGGYLCLVHHPTMYLKEQGTVFLDIEGEYDNTCLESITETSRRKGIEETSEQPI